MRAWNFVTAMQRIRSQKGFTIIELLLILVLIAILYKIFVPRYTKLAIVKHHVYATAHDLAADLRYARRLAMGGGLNGNTSTSLTQEPAFWLQMYTAGTATDSWRIFSYYGSSASPVKQVTIDDDVRISSTATDAFYFDYRGGPHPYTGGTILVEDVNSIYRWRVSVVRGTGKIELYEL